MARALPLLLALPLLALPGRAGAYLFELEAFDVTGNLEFHDDFEDGSRTAAPTGALIPLPFPPDPLGFVLGWIETESGGALRLTRDDEGPFGSGWEMAWLSSLFPASSNGTTTVTWTVREPGVPDTLHDTLFLSVQRTNHLLGLGTIPAGEGAGFMLGWDEGGFLSITFLVPGALELHGALGSLFPMIVGPGGFQLVDPAAVDDALRFEILLDHAAGTMRHRYSVDDGASWVTPLAPVTVPHGQYGMFLLAGDAVLFPEPSTGALLLGSGLAALASRRAFRTGAGARPRRGRRPSRA